MTSNTRAGLFLALGCAASLAVSAQIKPDGQWRGSGGAALSVTSGNTSGSSLALTLDSVRATASDKLSLGAGVNYARNKSGNTSVTTSNKWGGFGQYDYNLSPQTFVFGRLGLEGDQLIDLDRRMAVAGGIGYKVWNTKESLFEVFGGLGYTTDKYATRQTIGGKTGTSFSRSSIYLGEASSHQLSPTMSFKQRLDLYPGISGDKALLAKFSAGLGVAVNSTMNLTVGLTNAYNSKPPAGTKSNDLGLFTGVNVKFGAP